MRWHPPPVPSDTAQDGYIPVSADDDEKTILCRALQILKRTVEEKDALLDKQEPKVQFANAITASDGSILVREIQHSPRSIYFR